MDCRTSWQVERRCILIGGVLLAAAFLLRDARLLFAASAVTAAGVLQSLVFCRCPGCGAFLDPRGSLPERCPRCGKELPAPKPRQ